MGAIKQRWLNLLDSFQAWGEASAKSPTPPPTDADRWAQARGMLGDLLPEQPDPQQLTELRDAFHTGRNRTRIDVDAVVEQVRVLGRHALVEHTGAAVTFDREAFGVWCGEPDRSGRGTRGQWLGLNGTFDSFDHDAAALVENVLFELRQTPHVWRTGPGVRDVAIWRTADAEGVDGGGVVTVNVDGVELSAGHLQAGDLVYGDGEPDGRLRTATADAAEMAIANIAEAVNEAAARYRTHTAALPQAATDVIGELYHVAKDHEVGWLDDLMTAAGLMWRCPCGWMGRSGESQCGRCSTPRDTRCRWCGQEIAKSGDGWSDADKDALCPNHVEGCGACDDGEPHPHEPAEDTPPGTHAHKADSPASSQPRACDRREGMID